MIIIKWKRFLDYQGGVATSKFPICSMSIGRSNPLKIIVDVS